MLKKFLIFSFVLINFIGNAQTVINLEKVNGVYLIPCTVNDLNMKFIFDTGASDVILSLTEADQDIHSEYLVSFFDELIEYLIRFDVITEKQIKVNPLT